MMETVIHGHGAIRRNPPLQSEIPPASAAAEAFRNFFHTQAAERESELLTIELRVYSRPWRFDTDAQLR